MSGDSKSEPRQNRQQNGEPSQDQPQQEQPPQGQPPQGQPSQGQQYQQATSTTKSEIVDFAKVGALSYLAVGVGIFLTFTLTYLFGDENAGFFAGASSDELWLAVSGGSFGFGALSLTVYLAPVIAAALAVYYYRTDSTREDAFKSASVASGAGFLGVSVLMLLLATIFAPNGANVEIGKELAGLIGALIGIVLTAAGTGLVLENDVVEL